MGSATESSTGRSIWMSIQTIMTKKVVCVRASSKVREAWLLIMEAGISGAPVVNDEGNLVGVLSNTDIYKNIVDRYQKAQSLSELTTHSTDPQLLEKEELRELSLAVRGVLESSVASILPLDQKVLSVGSGDSIERALHLMAEHNINRLPVLKDDKVVGIVTRQDIIWLVAGRPSKQHEE